jgi:hypothetical protein
VPSGVRVQIPSSAPEVEATWPSGKAGVCKTPIGGSNPPVASNILNLKKPLLLAATRALRRSLELPGTLRVELNEL